MSFNLKRGSCMLVLGQIALFSSFKMTGGFNRLA